MPKTKPYTVSKTKTYTMPKTKVDHEWRTQHVTWGIDIGLSFFLLLLSSLTMERIIISMLSVWMIPKSKTTAHLLWRETSCITCLFPSQVDEEGSGRPARWQTQKGDSDSFSKFQTQLFFICIDCISSGWRWRTSALWSQRQASWLLIVQLDNLCYCSLGLCIHYPYPFRYPDNKEMY